MTKSNTSTLSCSPQVEEVAAEVVESLFPSSTSASTSLDAETMTETDSETVAEAGEIFTLVHPNDEQQQGQSQHTMPQFIQGLGAKLDPLRKFETYHVRITTNPTTTTDMNNTSENLLYHIPHARVRLSLSANDVGEEDDNNGNENENGSSHREQIYPMQIFVTTKRVLFVHHSKKAKPNEGRDEGDDMNGNIDTEINVGHHDFIMDAGCISLHALTTDPINAVYCQLSEEMDMKTDESTSTNNQPLHTNPQQQQPQPQPSEIYMEPIHVNENGNGDGDDSKNACQDLFRALSKLMNMNPDPYDSNIDGGGGGGLAAMLGLMASAYGGGMDMDGDGMGMGMGMGMGDNVYNESNGEGEHDDDDMICRINGGNGIEATPQQRAAMLERLDNLLVVPPEYEIGGTEGQFDDADENEDEDANIYSANSDAAELNEQDENIL